ncbi:antifreeze protein [Acidimangrovimonas sediminis]|uniref:antifreeze protein n=1 Tax=Acidimangrovimonas sediminis TaxID=2056283 RepID=UPI000C8062EE|nr:antifreeze protein [Acidimangrovimonas sediminis]
MSARYDVQVQMMRLGVQTCMMLVEAQWVITLRLWGMAGAWNVSAGENRRMVTEKTTALTSSAFATHAALVGGAGPAAAALAGMKPIRTRTRANARRLTKRGPRLG